MNFFNFLKPEVAHAHCDIPCGIYDPIVAQIAALSAIRMIDQINEIDLNDKTAASLNKFSRCVAIKESEVEKAKNEIRVIWGDFIKAPHLETYPQLHTIAHNIMMLGGATRQNVDRVKALEFLNEVNNFAEIFWKIKGVETKRAKAPYAPNEELVYPVL